MRTVDDRLRAAADETREYTANQWPTPPKQMVTPEARPKGWLVFAAAFATVIVVFAALPWVLGTGQTGTASQPELLTTPSTIDSPSTTVATVAVGDCSVSGAPIPESVEGLPTAVAETRGAIIDAALGCEIQAVIELAGPGFVTSFGAGDAEGFRTWEQDGEGRLGTLVTVLATSHGVVDDGQGGEIYVWPSAYAYESWDEIPPEAIEELSSLHTEAELDLFSQFGAYTGWRIGIDESGDWMYFVAGD